MAGWGTDHFGVGPCKFHGGASPGAEIHGARILRDMRLRAAMAKFAHPIDINPEQALLALVREAAGNVAWIGARLDTLLSAEGTEGTDGAEGGGQPGTRRSNLNPWSTTTGYDKGGNLFGPRIAVDKDGGEHVIGEEARGMLALYNSEREHLRKVAKDAIVAGIAKAQVEVAQQQGQQLALIINRVLDRMGLDEAKIIVARELMAQEMRQLQPAAKVPG